MTETLEHLRAPLLLAATLACGLQAGTYYTWASGVMPGLHRVDDRTFVESLQQINLAIVNPAFLASFVGAPLLAAAAVFAAGPAARPWVVAGLGLALGTVVISAVGNIPLNDALDAAGHRLTDPGALARARGDFETGWVRWNLARALTSAGALGCLAWAALRT